MKGLLKKIISITCLLLVIVAFIIGDYICYLHAGEISSHLSPDKVEYDTTNSTEVLGASDSIIRTVGDEGTVMLKNNGALPLDVDDEEDCYVNIFGIGGTDNDTNGFFAFGKGSGSISTAKEDILYPKKALEDVGFLVNNTLYDYFKGRTTNPTPDWWHSADSARILNHAKAWSETAIVFISRFTGENTDDIANSMDTSSNTFNAPWTVTYEDNDKDGRNAAQISQREEAMLDYCMESFSKVIVVVNSSNVMELGKLDEEDVDAVLFCPYTGQSGAAGLADIIAGKVSPSARLAATFPYDTTKDPTWANAFCFTSNGIQLIYAEDIYVGYRWYETAYAEKYFENIGTTYDKVVWRPFGYGESYTTFSHTVQSVRYIVGDSETPLTSGDVIGNKSAKIRVSVEVKNTGSVAGKDVLQVYASAPYEKGKIEKPAVVLAAFGKTDTLYPESEAGEDKPNSRIVTMEFNLYDIASYDCYDDNENGFKGYELDGGQYTVQLRKDSHTVDDAAGAEFTFRIPDEGFKFETDPVTGGAVKNRFTGEAAEYGVPIDGSAEGNEKITYLSRADLVGTFPTARAAARVVGCNVSQDGIENLTVGSGDEAVTFDEYYYGDVQMPETGSTKTKHLLFTLENGSKAAIADLNRTSGNTIVPNEELIMKLGADYDAKEWEELVSQLTFDELATIVARCSCGTLAAESVGKPVDMVFDGPQGLNNSTLSFDKLKNVSGFTAEIMLAQTFNAELARQVGLAMGKEVSAQGVIGMYAPAVDVTRHAYNGRNFEQFGEDPLLSGIFGAKVVSGLMDQGLQCSVKHFVCSTPGKNPRNYNSWLTERTLREIYLKPFERCVKEGGANFIMTSFNNIGGVITGYSYSLNTGVLREEWGFKGSVITDYNVTGGNRTTANLMRAGNDLRFSGSAANKAEVSADDPIDVYLLQRSVKNSLYSFCNSYYRAKKYDPNYETTDIIVTPSFKWWIMVLAIVETLAVLGLGWFVFRAFKPAKKGRKAAKDKENKNSEKDKE